MKRLCLCIMLYALPISAFATFDSQRRTDSYPNIDPGWINTEITLSRAMILSGAFTSPNLVLKAYENNSFRALWVNRINDSSWIKNLRDALSNLKFDALPVWRYNVKQINQLSNKMDNPNLLDLFITDALITAIADLRGQKLKNTSITDSSQMSKIGSDILPMLWELQIGRHASILLDSFKPKQSIYFRLRNSYKKVYGTNVRIFIPDNRYLSIGNRGSDVSLLARRLEAEGLLSEITLKNKPELFDRVLDAAVKTYQRSHGLKQDGIVGPNTRASLNRGSHNIAKIISLNIQHLRTQFLEDQII